MMKSVFKAFVDSHKYQGKWNKGFLVNAIWMDIGIAGMIAGPICLGIGFHSDWGLGYLLLGIGIFCFAISCFGIAEDYNKPSE